MKFKYIGSNNWPPILGEYQHTDNNYSESEIKNLEWEDNPETWEMTQRLFLTFSSHIHLD